MKPSRILLPGAIATVLFFSMCDFIPGPNAVLSPTVQPLIDTTKRVAVIESWMGHLCFDAHFDDTLDALSGSYGQSFIAITIHDNWFGEPCPPHPLPSCAASYPNAFSEDFRCPTGADYGVHFPGGTNVLVTGLINRRYLNSGNEYVAPLYWRNSVDTVVNQSACGSIHLDHTYNASTRDILATVRGTWLQAYSGTINVSIMLVEDSLLGWQVFPTYCDSQYVFNNVLRDCINTPGVITGSPLFSGTTTIGTTYNYTMPANYTLPAGNDETHCFLIALMYDVNTGEILQAWKEQL